MQTGPRTVSTARRCSAFSPSRIGSTSTRSTLPTAPDGGQGETVSIVCQFLHRLRDAPLVRHRRVQIADELVRLAPLDEPLELREPLLEPRAVERRTARAADLRVRSRADGLALAEELLVQLLAAPAAREGDLDVLAAREPDHVAREVDDAHGFAHVEDEHVAAAADRARLQDERDRL